MGKVCRGIRRHYLEVGRLVPPSEYMGFFLVKRVMLGKFQLDYASPSMVRSSKGLEAIMASKLFSSNMGYFRRVGWCISRCPCYQSLSRGRSVAVLLFAVFFAPASITRLLAESDRTCRSNSPPLSNALKQRNRVPGSGLVGLTARFTFCRIEEQISV